MIVSILKEATKCKYCGSNKLQKDGIQKGAQRYMCKECKVRFTQNEGFPGFVYPAEVVITAIDLRKENYESKEVIKIIEEKYGMVIGKRSIFRWQKWARTKNGKSMIKRYEKEEDSYKLPSSSI